MIPGVMNLPFASTTLYPAGAGVQLQAMGSGEEARLLLVAGRPLGEPIVQYGPFVMNSAAEIEQALDDYRAGRFGGRIIEGR